MRRVKAVKRMQRRDGRCEEKYSNPRDTVTRQNRAPATYETQRRKERSHAAEDWGNPKIEIEGEAERAEALRMPDTMLRLQPYDVSTHIVQPVYAAFSVYIFLSLRQCLAQRVPLLP